MTGGSLTHTLNSVNIPEIVKICGEGIEILEGMTWREVFKVSLLKKFDENLLKLRLRKTIKGNIVKEILVKEAFSGKYGENNGKVLVIDINV